MQVAGAGTGKSEVVSGLHPQSLPIVCSARRTEGNTEDRVKRRLVGAVEGAGCLVVAVADYERVIDEFAASPPSFLLPTACRRFAFR